MIAWSVRLPSSHGTVFTEDTLLAGLVRPSGDPVRGKGPCGKHIVKAIMSTLTGSSILMRLAVSDARVALPNFYDVAIGIANIAARLTVLVLGLRDELGSSTSPQFIAGLNICNADIHEAADQIEIWEDAERYRRFIRCRTTPGVDKKPRVRDLDVPRRAFAVAPAQNATSEDGFVKSKRSLDVGDGEKVCDPSCGGI
jgi:hypothetical protein